MLYLSGYDHLEALEAFRNGWIQVQDLSPAWWVWQQRQKRVPRCWMCAERRRKEPTSQICSKGSGHVTVRDLSDYKVQMIEDTIDRSGFPILRRGLGCPGTG